jgi:heterodisulfide reductase subunit C1
MTLYERLNQDIRFEEGLKACMNCGICTAICPAAEFLDYDPRVLLTIVQTKDDIQIETLLKSDFIWNCGQCMSCKMRCPRGNFPGMIINVLRKVSQETGYFIESKKGRQQYAIMQTIGQNILNYGYCIHPSVVKPEMHPEQGPVWEWVYENRNEIFKRLGANLDREGSGAMRKISDTALTELKSIFDITGGTELWNSIEKFSKEKAQEEGYGTDEEGMKNYFDFIYKK